MEAKHPVTHPEGSAEIMHRAEDVVSHGLVLRLKDEGPSEPFAPNTLR
jgi:hypothetical protein